MKRRMWRRRLARRWLDGLSFWQLGVIHRMPSEKVEEAVRRVVRVKV